MRSTTLLLPVLVAAGMLSTGKAEQNDAQPLRGPVLGFVTEQTTGLRPILGVPGAATLGQPIAVNTAIHNAALSPRRNYGLATAEPDGRVLLLRNVDGVLSADPLAAVGSGVSRVALSPAGSAAALYSEAARRIQVLTGLPDAPEVSWSLAIESPPGAIAVSDDARAVLTSAAEGDRHGVYLLTPEDGRRYLLSLQGRVAATFLYGRLDAVLAGAGLNRILLVRDVTGSSEVVPLADDRQGVSAPVAVAASEDNRRIFIANADPGGVITIDVATGEATTIGCDCVPTGLEPLSGNSVFRLNEPGDGPLYVLDAGSAAPRIVFVPAGRGGGAQ
jgi:hypothetical protein